VNVSGARPRQKRALNWYLSAEVHEQMREALMPKNDNSSAPVSATFTEGKFVFHVQQLPFEGYAELERRTHRERQNRILVEYADWTVETGLRVEESLRLCRSHFTENFRNVRVPGIKTKGPEATLPLSTAAQEVAARIVAGREGPDVPMFPMSYQLLSSI
jgi:hypothetical protein